jgi:hypothetical protein
MIKNRVHTQEAAAQVMTVAIHFNQTRGSIRNGFMPHIMGHKLSHIYAHEIR